MVNRARMPTFKKGSEVKIPTNFQSTFMPDEEIPSEGFAGPFFFDLETLPDFQRQELFGLPEVEPYKAADPVRSIDDILGLSVDAIRKILTENQPTEAWLEKMRAAETAGKNRKTVFQEIDKAIERMGWAEQQEAANNKKMGTTPEMCQIVSMGYACGSADEIHSMTVGDVLQDGSDSEKVVNEWDILEAFWKMAKLCKGSLCGYNIVGFDIPVILARSIILGIAPTRSFDSRPWSDDFCDLMLKRWPVRGTAGKLKELAPLYGIEVPAEGVDGGSVLPLWEEDRLDLINEYVRSDVQVTRDLYHLFEGYFV